MNGPVVRVLEGTASSRAGWVDMIAFRDLLFFLVRRDLKVRYSQSILGLGWAILPPVTTAIVFTFVFGRVAKVETGDVPYAAFAFAGLVPWTFLATSIQQSTASVGAGASMLSKVFFPRLFLPLSAVIGGLVDLAVAFLLMVLVLLAYGVTPGAGWLLLPLPLILLASLAFGVGLILSSIAVLYRDVKYGVPLVLQLALFATPVAYPPSLVPESLQWIVALNPMAGLLDAFRAALFGSSFPWSSLGVSAALTFALLVSGTLLFRKLETSFADVA